MSDPERNRLDAELLAWIGEVSWRYDEERFERLALALFAYQVRHCDAYARFCARRGITSHELDSWRDIPAVPTGAFKELALHSFPVGNRIKTFRTSGTSSMRRGELHLDTLALYEASLLASLRRFLFLDLEAGGRMTLRILAPSPAEAPDSSLSHMFGSALGCFGDAESGFDWQEGALQTQALLEGLHRQSGPVALCGTAFAFVHLLEAMQKDEIRLELPPGSRVMETGGFKGRSRELERSDLYQQIEARLGVPGKRVVNQYGMTELACQFYDTILREPRATRRKQAPPWARVRIVDPEDGRDAVPGEAGMIVIHDLANSGSIAALQTADLGRRIEDGFEVLGRAPGAEERGCSIAADAMLAQ